ncbi:MAG TPA: response regulator transcription factor [Clostridiales bacterium]|nr:response regulator transcription factor [Clostridiales bacterium]
MAEKILIVEDESSIRGFIRINLERNGYIVFEAETGESGIELVREQHLDIVILDIMLPGIDGFEVCRTLREEFPLIGIIMLTARDLDMDRIMGLEFGADDYIVKPFNPMELVLRVEALIRRMGNALDTDEEHQILKSGPFVLDNYSQKFFKGAREIDVTPKEYNIIKLFMENPYRAFSRDEILDQVWGYDYIGDTKIIDVNIRRLRRKIEDCPSEPKFIETVWGIGYRWKGPKD